MKNRTSCCVYFLPVFTNDGNSGGAPLTSSRWHVEQFFRYSDLALGLPSSFCNSTRRRIHAISLAFTYSSPDDGSNAAPPHSPPPSNPGNTMVPSRLGGTNWPALRTFRKRSSTAACASDVRFVGMSSVRICRENAGGFNGSGCFDERYSPSTPSVGTPRSSIGNTGLPVSRSKI